MGDLHLSMPSLECVLDLESQPMPATVSVSVKKQRSSCLQELKDVRESREGSQGVCQPHRAMAALGQLVCQPQTDQGSTYMLPHRGWRVLGKIVPAVHIQSHLSLSLKRKARDKHGGSLKGALWLLGGQCLLGRMLGIHTLVWVTRWCGGCCLASCSHPT